MKYKFSLVLLFICSIVFLSCSANPNSSKKLPLDSGWAYSVTGVDGPYLPLENQYLDNLETLCTNEKGYIWLKNSFILPYNYSYEKLSLYLGVVKIAEECYINDKFLGKSGSFPQKDFFNGESPISFAIPQDNLYYGKDPNTLLIKMWVNGYGRIDTVPYLDKTEIVEINKRKANFLLSELPFSISFYLLIVTLFYVFLYIVRPKEKSNFSFARLTFLSSLFLTNYCITEYPLVLNYNFLVFQKIFNNLVPIISIYYAISFIRDYLEKTESLKRQLYRKITTGIICIVPLFAQDMHTFKIMHMISYFISTIMLMYAVRLILIDLKAKKKRVKRLLIGFSPILASLVIALVVKLLLDFPYAMLIVIFGWQITIFLFLCLLLKKYANMFNHVEYVNANLEKLVRNKTKDLRKVNDDLQEINAKLELQQHRNEREMELASFVQQNFFKLSKNDFKDWKITYYFKPLESVSGDLYDVYVEDGELKGCGIFDISGHGLSSGLVTMLVKNIIQNEFSIGYEDKLDDVVYLINDRIIEEKGSIENYLTGIITRIKDSTLELVNAGHPEPVLIKANGKCDYIKKQDPSLVSVIGISGIPAAFSTKAIKMEQGESLLLYTDGVTEAANEEGNFLGNQKLMEIITKHSKLAPEEMLKNIVEDLNAFIGNAEIKDDTTILILTKK